MSFVYRYRLFSSRQKACPERAYYRALFCASLFYDIDATMSACLCLPYAAIADYALLTLRVYLRQRATLSMPQAVAVDGAIRYGASIVVTRALRCRERDVERQPGVAYAMMLFAPPLMLSCALTDMSLLRHYNAILRRYYDVVVSAILLLPPLRAHADIAVTPLQSARCRCALRVDDCGQRALYSNTSLTLSFFFTFLISFLTIFLRTRRLHAHAHPPVMPCRQPYALIRACAAQSAEFAACRLMLAPRRHARPTRTPAVYRDHHRYSTR